MKDFIMHSFIRVVEMYPIALKIPDNSPDKILFVFPQPLVKVVIIRSIISCLEQIEVILG
jgi:hypothetical protein